MNPTDETANSIAAAIQNHLDVCSHLLALAQKEAQALKNPGTLRARAAAASCCSCTHYCSCSAPRPRCARGRA